MGTSTSMLLTTGRKNTNLYDLIKDIQFDVFKLFCSIFQNL